MKILSLAISTVKIFTKDVSNKLHRVHSRQRNPQIAALLQSDRHRPLWRIPLHKIRTDVRLWAVERMTSTAECPMTPSVLQDTMPYKMYLSKQIFTATSCSDSKSATAGWWSGFPTGRELYMQSAVLCPLQYSHCSRKYSKRFLELICQGCCGCHLWHSCSDPEALIVVPSTMELRNPTQVWLKKHRKKFQASLKPPHLQAVIQQFFALAPEKFLLLDRHMYSNSTSAHNKSLQASMSLDEKEFGIRFQKGGETVLFSRGSKVHAAPFYSEWQKCREIKRTTRLHLMTLTKRGAIISLPLSL